jgi:hypothetical protein
MADLIIDSFAGGGASEDASLREHFKFNPFMPGKEHHGDFTLPTPHDAAEYVAISVVVTEEDLVRWNLTRVNNYQRSRALHVTQVARKRHFSPIHPYSAALNIQFRTSINQNTPRLLVLAIGLCLSMQQVLLVCLLFWEYFRTARNQRLAA